MRRRWLGLGAVALVGLLPACGDDGGDGGAACPPSAQTRAAANGAVSVCGFDIRFDTKTITAPAGPLTVTMINKGSLPHTFTIRDKDFELATPRRNAVETGTVSLEPGTYDFVCTIAGHEQAGMKGEVVVS
jgi:plastocyanin